MVEECGATVEQCWWNSVVEQCNSVGGIVEQCWWSSGTVMVNEGLAFGKGQFCCWVKFTFLLSRVI